MDRKVQGLAAGAAVLSMACGVATAASSGQSGARARAELDVTLGTRAPGVPTSVRLRVLYKHPEDPARKPPPLTAASFELPAGLQIDGRATPTCAATDEQFRAGGRDACPRASRVGDGTLTATTGVTGVDPVQTDVTVFNGGDELIELVTFKGTNTMAGIDRLSIHGSTLTAHPPTIPGGPPDGRTSVREVKLLIPARTSSAGRSLIVSPPRCPVSGTWLSRGSFRFTDGGAANVSATTPCTPPARLQRARLIVRPRRVRAGRRVRLRFRARPLGAPCTRGATVRLAGRRVTTTIRGRASLRVRPRRLGRRPVTLTKSGCARGRAWIRVVR